MKINLCNVQRGISASMALLAILASTSSWVARSETQTVKECSIPLPARPYYADIVDFHPVTGDMLVSVGVWEQQHFIRQYDSQCRFIKQFKVGNSVRSGVVLKDGRLAIADDKDHSIQIYDLDSGLKVKTIGKGILGSGPNPDGITGIAQRQDGNLIAYHYSGTPNLIYIFDLEGRLLQQGVPNLRAHGSNEPDLLYLPKSDSLIISRKTAASLSEMFDASNFRAMSLNPNVGFVKAVTEDDLFVQTGGGKIQIVSADGALVKQIALNVKPEDISYAAGAKIDPKSGDLVHAHGLNDRLTAKLFRIPAALLKGDGTAPVAAAPTSPPSAPASGASLSIAGVTAGKTGQQNWAKVKLSPASAATKCSFRARATGAAVWSAKSAHLSGANEYQLNLSYPNKAYQVEATCANGAAIAKVTASFRTLP